jgi:hypothetical protein
MPASSCNMECNWQNPDGNKCGGMPYPAGAQFTDAPARFPQPLPYNYGTTWGMYAKMAIYGPAAIAATLGR